MSHLGKTADLAGAGFHNTSLSRLKDEMTKKIYWNFFEKKVEKVEKMLGKVENKLKKKLRINWEKVKKKLKKSWEVEKSWKHCQWHNGPRV